MSDEMTTTADSPLGNPLLPLGLGAAGLIMGLIALIVALSGGNDSQILDTKLAEAVQPIGELDGELEALALRLADIERSQNAGANQISRATRDISELTQQTKQALSQVTTEVNKNRELINQISGRLSPTSSTRTASPSNTSNTLNTTSSSPDSNSTRTASEQAPADGKYKIKKGDTFSSIAERYGITLTALLNANPGIEPRYLKVDQVINLP